MNQQRFEKLIHHLQYLAENKPSYYKWQLFGLALLGYGYIFLLVSLFGTSFAAILYFLINQQITSFEAVVMGVIVVIIFIPLLWIKLEKPEGILIIPEQAPLLFQLLDSIRQQLNAPKINKVLLTHEFNASIVQHPRLGIFGGYENYLLLGFPLMQAINREQFAAVIAHEFGHLSGEHGWFGAWIYRIRWSWYQVMRSLDQQKNWRSYLLNRFFHWYIPLFSAYSFVFIRLGEYEADRIAAQVVGQEVVAQALLHVTIKGQFLEEKFWPQIYHRAKVEKTPRAQPFTGLSRVVNEQIDSDDARIWLHQALSLSTNMEDTHPCLRERLSALQQTFAVSLTIGENAADYFFNTDLSAWEERCNRLWQQQAVAQWQTHYTYMKEITNKLEILEKKIKQGVVLALEQQWQHAYFTEQLENSYQALPLYQAILQHTPDYAPANYAMGRILLTREDERGIMFLTRAMEEDNDSIIASCEQIFSFLIRHHRHAEAEYYRDKAVAWQDILKKAQEERETLNQNDPLQPHALSSTYLDMIINELKHTTQIKQAYLVQKQVTYLPEKPLFLLGLVWKRQVLTTKHQLLDRLAKNVELPGELIIVHLNTDTQALQENIRRIEQSLIFNV